MSVYEGVIRFVGRTPIPSILPVGMEGEHNVQEIRLDNLPSVDASQVATLYMLLPDGTSGDVIAVIDSRVTLTRTLMQAPGCLTCWIVISVNDTMVWKSDIFKLKVSDLPSIEEAIEQQYPTAFEQAIAQTGANMQAAQAAADAAEGFRDEAEGFAESAGESAADAENYKDDAAGYAASAEASAQSAEDYSQYIEDYVDEAANSAASAAANAELAERASRNAEIYAEVAQTSAIGVKKYADDAEDYAALAAASSQAAGVSAQNAATSSSEASVYSSNASQKASAAEWSANAAATSASNAASSASQAAASAAEILGMDVEATTLPAGSQATADYQNGVLTLGLPTGATGAQGIQGPKGDTGDTGSSGVYVGSTEPTDPSINVWIDSDGTILDPIDIEQYVEDWLDDHPEATTTVQDGSITKAKLDASLQETVDDVDELKSALAQEEKRLGEFDKGVFVHPVHWERGTISTSSGADQANNYRIRSDRVYFGDYDEIDISFPTGYSWYVFAYDSNDSVVGKQGWNNTQFGIPKTLYAGTVYLRYIIQVKDQSTTIVPMTVVDSIKVWSEALSKASKGDMVCYVSTTGSNSNTGSKSSPFATVQYAIDNGYKNICVLSGTYSQTVVATDKDGINIFADNTADYVNYTQKEKPIFTNGRYFSTFSTDGSGYKYFALSNAPSTYTAVFINHTQDPIITGDYPSYRASLWANHANKYDDFRVKPVLTYEELTEDNTFYYDGTNVYFHISDANLSGVTVGGANSYIFDFSNCNNLHINGINIMYADNMNLRILKSNNVIVENCSIGYTMRSNCVTTNYSNVYFRNCEAFKATIDGFNGHYYGVSIYDNCIGAYNYDDGESSHEYCEIIVIGGEYHHNAKGGHAPVNGCKFKCNGTYTHHNKYGFYMVGGASFTQEDILISNSVAKNNVTYDIQNTIYNTKYWNCKIGTTHVSSGTLTNLSE